MSKNQIVDQLSTLDNDLGVFLGGLPKQLTFGDDKDSELSRFVNTISVDPIKLKDAIAVELSPDLARFFHDVWGSAVGAISNTGLGGYMGYSPIRVANEVQRVQEFLRNIKGKLESESGAGDSDEWTLARASRETGVASWVWSRAAAKPSDKTGHLPTRRAGNNVYVTRENAMAFARDFDARREQREVGSKRKDGRNIVAALKEFQKTSRRSTERKSK